MPAEWQPHASTWMAWPHDADQWVGMLDPVRWEFAALVRAVAEADGVDLLVADEESAADARSRLDGAAVRYHLVPHQDLWLRDSGPIFVTHAGDVALTDWEFNGWGGKYPAALDNRIAAAVSRILGVSPFETRVVFEGGSIEVNGEGTGLTTRQCLLSPARNPGLDETAIEQVLREFLGIDRLIWLDEGLEGDHTDGHIDTLTRFADAGTIVTSVCHDRSDANHATLAANLAVLGRARREDGRAFTIVELPVPTGRVEFEGERLPLTYANFYLANGVVIVPIYGAAEDREALEILRTVFPERTVVPLDARALITGGGAFHCVTQQQPAGRLWSRE
jgi:agmatine deiminase